VGIIKGCKPPAQLSKLHIIGERLKTLYAYHMGWCYPDPESPVTKGKSERKKIPDP
jgi:hypothetical protein